MKLEELSSWLGVFKRKALYVEIGSSKELAEMLTKHPEMQISGNFHSYNQEALRSNKIGKLVGPDFKSMSLLGDVATIGAACTVEEVMEFLLSKGKRLINSGNYRKQTLIGAAITGTHGFGPKASIADSILSFIAISENKDKTLTAAKFHKTYQLRRNYVRCVTSFRIQVADLCSFKVTAEQKRLKDIRLSPGQHKAFMVLPYSNKQNPVAIETHYEKLDKIVPAGRISKHKAWHVPWSAWQLKAFWWIDKKLPFLRAHLQKALNYINIPAWTIFTDPKDIDSLYHPWPGVDDISSNPRFGLWSFKPTYTGYNISLFFLESEYKEGIQYIIDNAHLHGPKNFLFSFIGCRYLSTPSKVSFAGNYKSRRVAVDIYCDPKHADHLISLQRDLQSKFRVRSHHGKTVK